MIFCQARKEEKEAESTEEESDEEKFHYLLQCEKSSVADPYPVFLNHSDPGKTGSESSIHKNPPVILFFSLYKIV